METLNKKMKRAERALQDTDSAFQGLNEGLNAKILSKWEKVESKAMSQRGKALKCYNVSTVKPESMAEVQMKLLDSQAGQGHLEGNVAFLASGIAIESAQ